MKTLFSLLALFAFTLSAQKPTFSWATQGQGTSGYFSTGASLAADTAGNIYNAGYFEDSLTFDSGNVLLVSKGALDMFLSKSDKNGKLLWVHSIGGVGVDGIIDIAVDLAGNVYATGTFSDTVDFDPDTAATQYLTALGALDVCVLKLNANGVFQWARKMSGNDEEIGSAIALDAGNLIVSGYFVDEIDMNPSGSSSFLTAGGYLDGWVCKLSNSGALIWSKQFEGSGGSSMVFPSDLVLDANGNIYSMGSVSETVDFNPGTGTANLSTSGDDDVYISKLDKNGAYVWAKQVGGSDYESAGHMALDPAAAVFLTGSFEGTGDFNPGSGTFNMTSSGGNDAFVLKLDASGNFGWAKKTSGLGDESGMGLTIDASKNIWVSGSFTDSADFDPSSATQYLTAKGTMDAFLLQLSAAGNFGHVQQIGGTSAEVAPIDLINKGGAIFMNGNFNGTVDFDPSSGTYNMTALGYEVFLLKLLQCKSTSHSIVANGCNNVTVNSQLYTLSGTYTQTLQNSKGCDSVLTIKVQLKNNGSTINASDCNSYTLNSQTYTASGTYKQTLTNQAGCDSVITLNLKILKSADTITRAACNTITINGQTYTSSGTYTQTLSNYIGCDSTLTIHLTIGSQNSSSSITRSACYKFTYLGTTYTSTGAYSKTIPNQSGCDSNITLNLTIYDTSKHTLTVTACRGYRLNGQQYSNTGTYVQKLTNFHGCDSLLTLNLTVNTANKTVTQSGNVLTATATGTYKWVDCDNGKQPIPGQTAKTFTATLNGSYAVIVTENGCTDTSVCFAVTGLSVLEIPSAGINIYPNPAGAFVNIQLILPVLNGRLQLFNTAGVMVMDQAAHGARFLVDVSKLTPGVYQIILKDTERLYRGRIMLNSKF